MPQIINTNIMSLNSQRNLNTSQTALQTSLQRLSSGLRINSAKDDAAGLAISERFTTQIRGLNQAMRNANDGISLAQTAEGALAEVTNNLQRIRELAVQSTNATNSASDRAALDLEVQQRIAEIDRISSQTNFNGQKILDGTFGEAAFQVGANVGETIGLNLGTSMRASAIGAYVDKASDASITVTDVNLDANYALALTSYTGVSDAVWDASTNSISMNGVTLKAPANGPTSAHTADSAYAKAAAINASNIPGVAATATNKVSLTGSGGAAGTADFVDMTLTTGTASYTLTINGTDVFNATGDTSIDAAIQQINSHSSTTGVVATKTTTGLDLVAADGRNIQVEEAIAFTGATDGDTVVSAFGTGTAASDAAIATDMTYRGQMEIKASSSVAIATTGTAATTDIGLIAGTNTLAAQSNIQATSVTSEENANKAILAVDSALAAVSNLRSTFGAIQNRFESTIANLSATTENLTASRSRILDTDFAAETANLTRAQILQQAGMAMLAQANQLPQNVLSLLR